MLSAISGSSNALHDKLGLSLATRPEVDEEEGGQMEHQQQQQA